MKSPRRKSLIVLLSIFIVSIFAMNLVLKLEFDFDFEKFFPSNDENSDFYREYREVFGSDNDFVLIGFENNEGVFDQDFLMKLDSVTQDLKGVSHVDNVVSVTNVKGNKKAPGLGQIYEYPMLRIDKPEKYALDSANIAKDEILVGTILSKDMKSTTIWVKHEQQMSKNKCDNLSDDLHRIIDNYHFDKVHFMGRSVGQKIYVEMMQSEMKVFMSLSFILVMIFLFIAFRSAWGIFIPILVMSLAIIWNLAIIKLLGQKIDSMLTILPTIIFVVGMSDLVHFLTRYLAEIREGNTKEGSIKITIKEVGLATLLTSITTALGFITLMSSPIIPIRNFGLYTAFGVMLAFFLAFTLLPALLIFIHKPKVQKLKKRDFWKPQMQKLFIFSLRNRKAILMTSLMVFILSLWGISTIVSNNYLLQGLSHDHPLQQEMRYFEDNFSGARPMEVAVIFNKDTDPLSPKVMGDLKKLEDYLSVNYGLNAITSFHSILRYADRIFSGKKDGFEDDAKRIKKSYKMIRAKKEILNNYYSEEKNMARIYGQTDDLGRIYYHKKAEALDLFMKDELGDADFTIKLTGTAQLIDRSNEILTSSMIYGLAIAFIMIAILFGFLFKSWPMLIISFIPNILPLVMIGGVMGTFGIEFKVSNAIIFTIIFGIAVDDTIHFLSKFRMEIRKGKSLLYAIKRTFLSSGKAIVITSLILIAGFLSLILSDFHGTFSIGLLISLALVFAVISDLLLLPVLLYYLYRE